MPPDYLSGREAAEAGQRFRNRAWRDMSEPLPAPRPATRRLTRAELRPAKLGRLSDKSMAVTEAVAAPSPRPILDDGLPDDLDPDRRE